MSSVLRVKKESRILGLDTCARGVILGTVTRGGAFLDGVLVFREKTPDSLAGALRITPYFPELRGIMIHDEKGRIDPLIVEKKAELPVVVLKSLRSSGRPAGRLSQRESNNRSRPIFFVPSNRERIIALTTTRRGTPEPVRIAHLLAKLPIFRNISHDKR